MKHNLKSNKVIQYLGTILLASILMLSSVAATPPTTINSVSQTAISKYFAAQQNPNLSDEDKIKSAVDAYFATRYEGQKFLVAQDFSPLLEDNTLAWVQKEKDKREIELYLASLFDLKYVSYNYTLDYDSIQIKNNKATVQLRESHTVVFEALAPETSELSNLPHVFTLHNKRGQWVIYKDEYQDELSEEMTQLSKEKIESIVDQNYIDDLNRRSQKSGAINSSTSLSVITPSLATHAYSAIKATSYADTYWSSYNTTYYKTEYYGTTCVDCANFVSQAIYAGEGKTPPDTSGMAQPPRDSIYDWYYVFNNPPGTQNGSGSKPWINVQSQMDFIRNNTSQVGPYGVYVYFANVTAGDPVYISQSSTHDHEGIIITKGSDLSHTTLDAHCTNRHNYPLSNWATYTPEYVHIQGWQN